MTPKSTHSAYTRHDVGFTLVEVLIATILLGVLAGIGTTLVIRTTQVTADLGTRAQTESQLNDAMLRVVDSVHRADTVESAQPHEVVLSMSDSSGTTCSLVRYRAVGDTFSSGRADCANPTAWTEQTIVRGLTSANVFTYYTADYSAPPTASDTARIGVAITVGSQGLATSAALRCPGGVTFTA